MNNYQSKRYVRGDIEDILIPVFIVLLIIAVIVGVTWACVEDSKEQKAWGAFKIQHHCKITAYMDGSTSTASVPVVGSNGSVGVGVVTNTVPSKAAWLCDDGITYWKNQ